MDKIENAFSVKYNKIHTMLHNLQTAKNYSIETDHLDFVTGRQIQDCKIRNYTLYNRVAILFIMSSKILSCFDES